VPGRGSCREGTSASRRDEKLVERAGASSSRHARPLSENPVQLLGLSDPPPQRVSAAACFVGRRVVSSEWSRNSGGGSKVSTSSSAPAAHRGASACGCVGLGCHCLYPPFARRARRSILPPVQAVDCRRGLRRRRAGSGPCTGRVSRHAARLITARRRHATCQRAAALAAALARSRRREAGLAGAGRDVGEGPVAAGLACTAAGMTSWRDWTPRRPRPRLRTTPTRGADVWPFADVGGMPIATSQNERDHLERRRRPSGQGKIMDSR